MKDFSMIKDVSFITTAVPFSDQGDLNSLILLRTPKYGHFLDENERGVNVSYENQVDTEDDLLEEIEIQKNVVKLTTKLHHYKLNISRVDKDRYKGSKENSKEDEL